MKNTACINTSLIRAFQAACFISFALFCLLYLAPGSSLAYVNALYLVFSQVVDGVVVIYNYRDTILCDNRCSKFCRSVSFSSLEASDVANARR